MDRVVSLLPSSTEIVCALGLEAQLVGRSHECDHPPSVAGLPVCSSPRLDPGAASAEIDRSVKSLVSQGLSVYQVDAERLRALAPDVILTQEQCEVCAVTPRDLEQALATWLGTRPRVVSLEPSTLGDVFADMLHVARALAVEAEGRRLVAELSLRISEIGEQTGDLRARPRVACLEWIDPLMADGNWMPELVRIAGGTPALGRTGSHSPWTSLEALAEADPDVVVVLPCGFDLSRTRREIAPLAASPGFRALRAVEAGSVALADGHQYFNRPGPRLVESLEILAEILHPTRFDFGHRGEGWEWMGESRVGGSDA
jgi:iron complex transport system substrate-binding protein